MYFTGRVMETDEMRGYDGDEIFFIVTMGKVFKDVRRPSLQNAGFPPIAGTYRNLNNSTASEARWKNFYILDIGSPGLELSCSSLSSLHSAGGYRLGSSAQILTHSLSWLDGFSGNSSSSSSSSNGSAAADNELEAKMDV
jgi:hypothetical protein